MFGSREKRPEKEHSGPCGLSLRLNVLYCPFRDATPTINPITSRPPRERHTNPYALHIGRQALAIVGCTGRTARRRFIALRISDALSQPLSELHQTLSPSDAVQSTVRFDHHPQECCSAIEERRPGRFDIPLPLLPRAVYLSFSDLLFQSFQYSQARPISASCVRLSPPHNSKTIFLSAIA